MVLFTGSHAPKNDQQKVLRVLNVMFDSIKSIQSLSTHIQALERLGTSFLNAESEIKLQCKPRKLYFINPAKKLEILYDSERSTKAIVKPHVFPYLTVHLDPNGNIMRKNQHYTIHQLGFDFIARSIALTLKNEKESLEHFKYMGRVQQNGIMCHLLIFEDESYHYRSYTVGEKESVTSLAYKLCVNDYLLREKNNLLNDFGLLKKGQLLMVPNLYCRKAVLYVDEQKMLPVNVSLFDEKGVFENYTFSHTRVNLHFGPQVFDVGNKEYNF